ncbi:hypothetical protein B0T25DRAFT_456072 [Lasiosphaeria hispida]|uniref:Uncharacterized protein n=1 Tax=Lasiosphaeria hispida TaxID=260671 RepID=A0AAJ0HJQ9_9PEZI|nr:hypothetical protein B0T25DRAFT_456072 [Lasiosphaeria hispida]
MADRRQREYSCRHFRWIASKWCKEYTLTHKRCQPNQFPRYTNIPWRAEEVCGECKPKDYIPWENMIRRSTRRPPPFDGDTFVM